MFNFSECSSLSFQRFSNFSIICIICLFLPLIIGHISLFTILIFAPSLLHLGNLQTIRKLILPISLIQFSNRNYAFTLLRTTRLFVEVYHAQMIAGKIKIQQMAKIEMASRKSRIYRNSEKRKLYSRSPNQAKLSIFQFQLRNLEENFLFSK